MKKSEAEPAIRQMLGPWCAEVPQRDQAAQDLNYSGFRRWADANHYGHYFTFRSTTRPEEDAEMWFDHALGLGRTR